MNTLTFRKMYERCLRRDCHADEFWLPSGKRADADSKMRCYFPPSLETVRVIDEVVSCDPDKMKKGWIGQAKLSFGGESYEVSNNSLFGWKWTREVTIYSSRMDVRCTSRGKLDGSVGTRTIISL
jgi:hypothetical protein